MYGRSAGLFPMIFQWSVVALAGIALYNLVSRRARGVRIAIPGVKTDADYTANDPVGDIDQFDIDEN